VQFFSAKSRARPVLAAVLALALCAGFATGACARQAAFAPPDQHFSIPFPPNAAETDSSPMGNPIRQWKATDGNFVYLVGHVISANGSDFRESQLVGDLNDFISGTKATLLSEESLSWPSPSGRAKALRCSFKMPNGLFGKGVMVFDGPLGYSAFIIDRHTGSQSRYMDQYIQALTILP
jgi:hypothetical protein